MPLRWVAFLGALGGDLAYCFDARHRKMARDNMQKAFPELGTGELRALTRQNFRRIGEAFACGVRTAFLSFEELQKLCEVTGLEKISAAHEFPESTNRIVAVGHFGNFELLSKLAKHLPDYQGAATYRGVPNVRLNALLKSIRDRSGCHFFDRRQDAAELKSALNGGHLLLGLLADQHAGRSGVLLPFLGRPCWTTAAPAVLALRYRAPLFTAICYRIAPGRWRIEVGDEIPLSSGDSARSVEDITRDINTAFESAVRRDPANWFWVHNRWKHSEKKEPAPL